MFFSSWCSGAEAAATLLKQESTHWYELNAWCARQCVCVCVCVFVGRAAAAAALRAGYRTGSVGLWGFSWLSERLKGRLLSGGSDREHRPLSVVFVASWRLPLNQKLCLCLSTARWKYGVWKGAINFMHGPPGELYRAKAAEASCSECGGGGLVVRLRAEWFVEAIRVDAGWLCCRQRALLYYVTAFFFFFLSYLFHVSSSSVDAAQIVNTSDAHTHTQRLDTLQSHN